MQATTPTPPTLASAVHTRRVPLILSAATTLSRTLRSPPTWTSHAIRRTRRGARWDSAAAQSHVRTRPPVVRRPTAGQTSKASARPVFATATTRALSEVTAVTTSAQLAKSKPRRMSPPCRPRSRQQAALQITRTFCPTRSACLPSAKATAFRARAGSTAVTARALTAARCDRPVAPLPHRRNAPPS